MEISVFNERINTTKNLRFSGKTVQELLHYLKINPETVIVVRNKEVIASDEILKSKDNIRLLSVISGG